MFRYPELYRTGIAVASVPDERLYDSIYQERYMGLPQVNELIARGKQFTMISYRNRSHGIYEGPGTTMHLYTMMTNFLKANLPPGRR